MDETTTAMQENGTVTETQEERTFTQTEMDAIIRERLGRERSKYADYEELRAKAAQYDAAQEAGKTELQKATERADALQRQLDALTEAETVRKVRETVSQATGVPATLLSGKSEDECKAQAQAILAFAKPGTYPAVKDGGEPRNKPSGKTTSEQFAEWFHAQMK